MLGGVGPLTTWTRVPAESSRVGTQGPCVPGAHARVKLPGHSLWHHPHHTGHQVVFHRLFPSCVGHLLAIPVHSSCHVAFWFLPTWVPGKMFTEGVFCLIMKSNIFSYAHGLFGFSRVTPWRDIPGAPWGPVVLFLDLTVVSCYSWRAPMSPAVCMCPGSGARHVSLGTAGVFTVLALSGGSFSQPTQMTQQLHSSLTVHRWLSGCDLTPYCCSR